MPSGLDVRMTGFGGHNSIIFRGAGIVVGTIIAKYSVDERLSFTQDAEQQLEVLDLKTMAWDFNALRRQITLPTITGILNYWEAILRETSAALEGTIVAIQVSGVTQAAIGGKIIGIDDFEVQINKH